MNKHSEIASRSSRGGGIALHSWMYASGQLIPASGTYRVVHAHAMQREVNLLKGKSFPRCAQCVKTVEFEMAQGIASESARDRFRLLMQVQ